LRDDDVSLHLADVHEQGSFSLVEEFLASMNLPAFPLEAEALCLFLESAWDHRLWNVTLGSVEAAEAVHRQRKAPFPAGDKDVRALLRKIREKARTSTGRPLPLPGRVFGDTFQLFVRPPFTSLSTFRDLRDFTAVLIAYRFFLRNCQLVSLNFGSFIPPSGGVDLVRLRVPAAKRTPVREVTLEEDSLPAYMWRLYRRAATDLFGADISATTPLFFNCKAGAKLARLSTATFSNFVKKVARAAGLQGRFSGYSCRSGGTTAAAQAGVSEAQIMSVGGWTSPAVARYIRADAAARIDLSSKLGLLAPAALLDQ
jgi:integrase